MADLDIEVTLIVYHFIKTIVREWNLDSEQEEDLHRIAQKILQKDNG